MELTINNTTYELPIQKDETLLMVLRERLDLTGSKYGCGEGMCGACTVLVNGTAVRSCITPASSVAGKKITTIEGIEQNGQLHPVQQAFLTADVFQCGYCAPGMIMSTVSVLAKNNAPTSKEIVDAMQGNICRCGAYPRIIHALEQIVTAKKD